METSLFVQRITANDAWCCSLRPARISWWQMRESLHLFCSTGSPPWPFSLSLTAADSPGGTSDLPTAHMFCLAHYHPTQHKGERKGSALLTIFP